MPITTVKCRWENGYQIFYDSSTFETIRAMAPIWYKEDFLGEGGLEEGNTVDRWEVVEVGNATSALRTDKAGGQWRLNLTGDSEAQDAVLYWGDQTSLSALNDLVLEARIRVATAAGTGVTAVWGVAGDHNLAKDSVAEHAWYRLQASANLLVETDDGTTDDDDNDTTTDDDNAWHIYRIDLSNLADVKFYYDGDTVLGGSTFDLSGLDSTTGLMQPYFSLDRASGTGLCTVDLDYVALWGRRSDLVDTSDSSASPSPSASPSVSPSVSPSSSPSST